MLYRLGNINQSNSENNIDTDNCQYKASVYKYKDPIKKVIYQ